MASRGASQERGFSSPIRYGRPESIQDGGAKTGSKRARAFPINRQASHPAMGSLRQVPRAANHRAAISPMTMRWGSGGLFALDHTGESKWRK